MLSTAMIRSVLISAGPTLTSNEMSSAFDSLSVWLTFAASNGLQSRVDACSQQAGTPSFVPHMTVVSFKSTDVSASLRQFHEIPWGGPCAVRFQTVVCTPTLRYRCVFALVQPDESVLSLHRAARAAFECEEEAFLPHVSLVYDAQESVLSPSERERLAQLAAPLFSTELAASGAAVELWQTSDSDFTKWTCLSSRTLA